MTKSSPMEDGEGGVDAGRDRGREETLVQVEREPALEPGSAGAHEDPHPLPLLVSSIPTGQEEEGKEPHFAIESSRITMMIRQMRGATLSSLELERTMGSLAMEVWRKYNAAPWIGNFVADLWGSLGSQRSLCEVWQRTSHSRFIP